MPYIIDMHLLISFKEILKIICKCKLHSKGTEKATTTSKNAMIFKLNYFLKHRQMRKMATKSERERERERERAREREGERCH